MSKHTPMWGMTADVFSAVDWVTLRTCAAADSDEATPEVITSQETPSATW